MSMVDVNGINTIRNGLIEYSIKGYDLINKCTDLQDESCSLGNKSISYFEDSVLEKVKNYVSDKLVGEGRTLYVSRLNDIKKEYLEYFNEHYNLFMQANELLKAKGVEEIDINSINSDLKLAIDNDDENDEWILDFAELCDKLRNFMQSTIDIADRLYSRRKRFA